MHLALPTWYTYTWDTLCNRYWTSIGWLYRLRHIGALDSHKSTLGYIFNLGSNLICWQSKKKNTIALSLIEAEYQGVVTVATKAIWLQHIMKEFGFDIPKPTAIHVIIRVLLRSQNI